MSLPRYRSGNPPGRPRKAPLGMNAARIQVAADKETRRALEDLLIAWKIADTNRAVSRADVVRDLIVWAAQALKTGNSAFLPRKRSAAG